MAQRFGGKYSPQGDDDPAMHEASANPYAGARVDPVGFKANFLFLPALPLLLMSLGSAVSLFLAIIAAASLTLGNWLLREGLRAEAAYNDRRVARRPAFPRKMAASLLTGAGVAIAAYRFEPGLAGPLLYGVIATILHSAAFGIDPLRDKGMEGADSFQKTRVATAVGEAEEYLKAMKTAIETTGDRALVSRVERFQSTARQLFRTVEDDPRDLATARKYLTVYLMGARDATIKFADVWRRNRSTDARASYLALLDDLEKNFAARNKTLLLDDRSDLNIEIDVLRERLQREGVATE
ncbi:5-bromo-4-chloroindolyl phosphate hydrolysis family protein [Chachezhania antarctica]|uniref:5-bromo-4-chloroindolyl phosphate hydrolysis family protein n=1 Tax=Chachezhania antarctica TaxID=2340860 RepID=UPI000EAE2FED|nr:5-bromo-4-chloroindolyl phosphate hydrolysis family protein [Chachezhania antarctica]|tara:strand:- start:4795 stop:5682 length:888 start_codon:yes stop_codon:yes gene_type:complete